MLEKLINLLGEENTKRLEGGITDIILEQVKNDFEGSDTYILSPDDVIDFAERCKEKAFANIEVEIIKNMEEKMRTSLLGDK